MGRGVGAGHGIMLGDRGKGVAARGSMVMGETWDGASHRRGGMGRIGFGGMGQVGLPALCSGTCSGAGTGGMKGGSSNRGRHASGPCI